MRPKEEKTECIDCRKLPEGMRPDPPRKIDKRSGPKSPRCWSHIGAKIAEARQREQERHQEKTYGLTPEDQAELDAFQGGYCPCGSRLKDTDHDHKLAREHGHPRGQACKSCCRGRLCANCNRFILGRGYDSTRLRALADYYDDPPALRLWGSEEASA